jgi:hypothetical protein
MLAPPLATLQPRPNLWALAIPAVVALAHAFGHSSWYTDTPLGQVPVLDEQENRLFAKLIFRGSLPSEPFYRAPGYAGWDHSLVRLAMTHFEMTPPVGVKLGERAQADAVLVRILDATTIPVRRP